MRSIRRRRLIHYYAKILVVVAFTFVLYGFFLYLYDSNKVLNPIDDFEQEEVDNESTNITTADEISDNSGSVDNTSNPTTDTTNQTSDNNNNNTKSKPKNNSNNTNSSNTNNNTNNSNNTNPSNTNNNTNNSTNSNSNQVVVNPPQDNNNEKVLTIDEINNNRRVELQNKYSVTIKYGSETEGYSVGNVYSYPIYDGNVISNVLQQLDACLALYPSGLFREIRDGGIPLTILLVSNYNDNLITGITVSNNSSATISIASAYPFGESFYHESYHYIERYLFKSGADFNTWDTLNPEGFVWNSINPELSYTNTYSPYASFVNNYAQTAAGEDRASTFEYMMASSKASCLNNGGTVWRKAKLMADKIDLILNTVRPDVVEYWERFL